MAKKVEAKQIVPMIEAFNLSTQDILEDAKKFDAGNNSAGTKVRVALLGLRAKIKDIRDAVTQAKEARKK